MYTENASFCKAVDFPDDDMLEEKHSEKTVHFPRQHKI